MFSFQVFPAILCMFASKFTATQTEPQSIVENSANVDGVEQTTAHGCTMMYPGIPFFDCFCGSNSTHPLLLYICNA